MNIYLRELKSHKLALIFWSIGIIALVASGMAKFAAYANTGQSIVDLMNQFPKSIQTIFGLSGFDLAKAIGFYGVLYMYIALMASIHASLLGSDLISKEERDKTAEFLFVRPISRIAVVTSKLLAGLTNIVILNIVTLISSVYFVHYFGSGETFTGTILVLMAGLLFLQLIFFSIGAGVAGISKKSKTASSVATSILMLTFFLMMFINFNDKLDFLKYLTPFKYFEALPIMNSGGLDAMYVMLSTAIVAAMITVTYRSYSKRDLEI